MAFYTRSRTLGWALATAPRNSEPAVSALCLPRQPHNLTRPSPGGETEAQHEETGPHGGAPPVPRMPPVLRVRLSHQVEAKQVTPTAAQASPGPWPAGVSEAGGWIP